MSDTNCEALSDFFSLSVPCDRHVGYWLQRRPSERRDFRSILQKKQLVDRPYQLQIQAGRKFTDFLGTGLLFLVISDRAVEVLQQESFSGWRQFPVSIYDKLDKKVKDHRYWGLTILGDAGRHDTSKGVTKWYTNPDGTKSVFGMNGLYFDLGKWDRSDFFTLKDSNWTLVTRRVVESLRKANITGWEATPVLEIRF